MNKFAIIFSLALFLTPLSALPQGGGYQALAEEAGIIDLENQAPRGSESARADDLVAVIVVDEEWLKKNGIEFNRAIHLNIDDECPLEHGTFRELFDAEAGALYVAQVMTDEQVRYFWYSGERLKAWLQKSMTDPQSRLPVKLVRYFNLDSIEAGKKLRHLLTINDFSGARSWIVGAEEQALNEMVIAWRPIVGLAIGLGVIPIGVCIGGIIVLVYMLVTSPYH